MRQLIGLQDTIDYYLCPKFEKTFSFLG
ncbi:transcriptional regulator, partial [Lactobacillus parabuchneri]|nr:transcriptional regulator [Lentilactobacillus parabuchneri]